MSGSATFGAEDPTRVLVGAFIGGLNISVINAVSIGGVSATLYARGNSANSNGGGTMADLWAAAVPTGTSGTVGWSFTPHGFVGFALYALYGARSAAPVATNSGHDSASIALPISVPAGSFVIGNAVCFATTAFAWTALTSDEHTVLSTTATETAIASVPGAANPLNVSVSMPTSSDAAAAVAAWGP